ncbi:MAG: formyltransferase family protein, partial [Rhodothermales bacterium]|nr:formyltransferase family protein [Rhodothermales bacterium]
MDNAQPHTPLRCYVMGEQSLTIRCAELLREAGHAVLGLISDAAAVVAWARERAIPVLDPGSDYAEALREEPFDYFFSIANLRIVPEPVLALPRRAAINFHDGPLPAYAGLNVPAWALMNREPAHGVTWHLMEARVDAGGILVQRTFPVA